MTIATENIDFLIIGQGLAGSLLAWELLKRGKRVLIADNGQLSASQVAAGIINPITGQRLVMPPDFAPLSTLACQYYQLLENFFGAAFLSNPSMLRILRNEAERRYCDTRLRDETYAPYVEAPPEQQFTAFYLNTPFGVLGQKQVARLNTSCLLKRLKSFFLQKGSFVQKQFVHQELRQQNDRFNWDNRTVTTVIFCEGHHVKANPWFSWLPLQPVKGEILTLKSPTEAPCELINFGHWLLATGNGKFLCGATFDRINADCQATPEGKKQLVDVLKTFYPGFSISSLLRHQAQIRPCTADRNPFIGRHPKRNNILIFNGFGARGSLMIPHYCQLFATYLLNNTPLPQQCNIERYYARQFAA